MSVKEGAQSKTLVDAGLKKKKAEKKLEEAEKQTKAPAKKAGAPKKP